MALTFARTRERNKSYLSERQRWYYSMFGIDLPNCYPNDLESVYPFTVVRKARIRDNPDGLPYVPGKLRLTNVEMSKVEDFESEIDFYQPSSQKCHPRLFRGYYGPSVVGAVGVDDNYLPPIEVDPKRISALRMQAYAKLNSSGTGLGESLAEAGQVLSMVRSPLKGLSNILRNCVWNARRGKFRNLRDASSAWLEYRYGWFPLVSTIKALIKPLKTDGLLDIAAKTETVLPSTSAPGWSFPVAMESNYVSFRGIRTSLERTTERYRLYYRVIDPQLYRGFHHGSTLFQAPQLFWELVPLSFVVDWWFNVGDCIAAMTPNPSVSIEGETYSYRYTKIGGYDSFNVAQPTVPGNPLPRYGIQMNASWSVSRIKDYYLRLVQVREPLTIVPSFNAAFQSTKHAVDALSLIIQRVPRRRS